MMQLVDALSVLQSHRRDEVVVATMGAEREWIRLSQHPRDFYYVPSSMGQAPTVGLGIAMGRPDLRVLVLNGDGCMLMNLGCLVTIMAIAPANYWLFVMDNGVYEVTGAQPTAAGPATDFTALARAAGFRRTYTFADLAIWRAGAAEALSGLGPVFVTLRVEPVRGAEVSPKSPGPMADQIVRMRHALSLP
jgi:thiamine pyrophosphate-dependent acetolactate synthase large subunit-like protein